MFFKTIRKYPLNIAHRGARFAAPENTLPAARKAAEFGADAWEFDVQMSSDGIPVVIHDNTLSRTSDVCEIESLSEKFPWLVHEFTLAELQKLNFGRWFIEHDPFGRGKPADCPYEDLSDIKLPTLWEALTFSKAVKLKINIEIKDLSGLPGDADVVEKVLETVRILDMGDEVLISSFNYNYLRKIKDLAPDISTAVLTDIPQSDPLGLLGELGAEAYNPAADAVDADTISFLGKEGFYTNVWTVNDENSMMKWIQAGVSGIFTDFPQILSKMLGQ